ncbi:hypothetical protein MMC27_001856 [Xylographa pallens]|nr:hypothetical protein [Xylographa pallens]
MVESTDLGDIAAFASRDGKGLLRNTRYLQALKLQPYFEVQMDSLYETLREFTLRPNTSFRTATILEAYLFTSDLHSERNEALALGPLIAHACSHLPNLRHIESQCSKRFERHFATATRKFYIEIGLVVDDINAAPFNHWEFAHYPESYDHVLFASRARRLQSSKCHNYNLALQPLVDMREWNLHRDLRHLSTLEMVFRAPSPDGPVLLLDKESRSFIITLSRLKSLKSLSLTLSNSWEYVQNCSDNHHGMQKLYLDDLLLEGRKRRSDDKTVYKCPRMDSLETIRFVNWPARPRQLKQFFFANRQNLKTIDMKRISLLAEPEEQPGESWTKTATHLHKHMQVLEDLELQCLTTH